MVTVLWQHFVFLQLQFIFVNKVFKVKVGQQTCNTTQLERPQPCRKLDKKIMDQKTPYMRPHKQKPIIFFF